MIYNLVWILMVTLFLSSCAFTPSFSGPKYNKNTRSLTVDPKTKVFLALTNAKLERDKRAGFDKHSREIFTTIKNYPGYMGGTVKVEIFGDEVWTMTVWESKEALDHFVNSARHLDALYMTNQAMKRFRHLHVTQ